MKTNLPRGIRNANPGNLEWGDPWQGLVPRKQAKDPRFCVFESPAYGIRALARTLITYQDKHGIRTIREIIHRWAPTVENDTASYVHAVSQTAHIGPTARLDLHDYKTLRPIVEAIIRHENGDGLLNTANTWYDNATIDEALKLAGVRKPAIEAAKLPVTKETVGATATGAVGIAQLADVAPQIMDAIDKSESHLSSGSMIRIVVGVLTIGIAVFIAWSQLKKHQAGAL